MHKVITIALSDRLFQLDEPGYDALRAYLDLAERKLAANPDKAEIVRDLEQSIGEKFAARLSAWKSVVAMSDVEQVLREIGPVEGEVPVEAAPAAAPSVESAARSRRLYQIREGAMISGVCNGIAAHLGIDPTLVRIAWVAAAIIETTIADRPPLIVIGLYVMLMFIVPYAPPSIDRAAPAASDAIPQKVHYAVQRLKALLNRLNHAPPM